MPEGAAGHGRTVEKRERTGPPEGSARETATGRLSGGRVVRSRKKERDAPESRVKVREAEADAVPESADALVPERAVSPTPESTDALAPRADASPAPRAAVKDSYTSPRQLSPAGDLRGLRELLAPRVREAAKAALGAVGTPTLLSSAVASAENVSAGTKAPTALTLCVPLTELLRGGDVARTLLLLLLLLALTASSAAPLRSSTPTTSATPASASTAATSATSATAATAAATPASTASTSTPTPATTSTATPTPSAASTTTSTAPTGPTRSLAPLALARAASPARGRRHSDRLKTTEVGRSGRGDRGQERGRRTPLKDGGAGVTSRGSYNNYALLCC
ncbi:unnamed protein product [Closterium sp. NIES-53]